MVAADSESAVKLLNEKGVHYGTGFMRYFWRSMAIRLAVAFLHSANGGRHRERRLGKGRWTMTAPAISETLEQENKHGRMLLRSTDLMARRVFGMAFATAFLLAFSANAFTATQAFTAMGLYVVLFLGSVKGAFFGLVAGVGGFDICEPSARHRKKA